MRCGVEKNICPERTKRLYIIKNFLSNVSLFSPENINNRDPKFDDGIVGDFSVVAGLDILFVAHFIFLAASLTLLLFWDEDGGGWRATKKYIFCWCLLFFICQVHHITHTLKNTFIYAVEDRCCICE